MDLALGADQQELADLARRILTERLTEARLRSVEVGEERVDRETWAVLAEAGLLGASLPEAHGGSGLGLTELCVVLVECGRTVAPVPAHPTLVLGAQPLAAFGTDEQQQQWLPGVATGEVVLSAALAEATGGWLAPATTARRHRGAWRLDGEKSTVPAGMMADRVLVPATTPDGVELFWLDPAGAGVERRPQDVTGGDRRAALVLRDAAVEESDRLPGGAAALEWLVARATVGMCALQVGVCERALEMTAAYASAREQFGRPIGSFQAVAHRAADAYVDLEALRLTTWQAVSRLDKGADARRQVMVAKYWASRAGHRVLHAAQHLHGGVGVDTAYPLHRYFQWSKQLELGLGSATPQLAELGRLLATEGIEED